MERDRDREKIVAICRDVIQQVKIRNYRADRIAYVSFVNIRSDESEGDLKEHLEEFESGGCEVCAIGAALVSKVRLYNSFDIRNVHRVDDNVGFINDYIIRENLHDIFTIDFLYEIERHFEGSLDGYEYFVEKYDSRNERLVALMQNIITNNGEIVIPTE